MTTTITPIYPLGECTVRNEMQEYSIPNQYVFSAGVYTIHKGTLLPRGSWRIKEDRVIELKREGDNYIVVDHFVNEYGIGRTETEAINDLLSSFADFRISLEKRQNKLSKEDKASLSALNEILE